jgi:hypothetical protein
VSAKAAVTDIKTSLKIESIAINPESIIEEGCRGDDGTPRE